MNGARVFRPDNALETCETADDETFAKSALPVHGAGGDSHGLSPTPSGVGGWTANRDPVGPGDHQIFPARNVSPGDRAGVQHSSA